jgi:hypothetical protein
MFHLPVKRVKAEQVVRGIPTRVVYAWKEMFKFDIMYVCIYADPVVTVTAVMQTEQLPHSSNSHHGIYIYT